MYYVPYYWLVPYNVFAVYESRPSAGDDRHMTHRQQSLHGTEHHKEVARNQDQGPNPFVWNIHRAARQNAAFRTAVWTGSHLQITLMAIPAGEDIGLEVHPDVDQFLRVEEGRGLVQMGSRMDTLPFRRTVDENSAIIIPAGTWHNITNTGTGSLKLYSIYAPPNHPFGTVHDTKADDLASHDG